MGWIEEGSVVKFSRPLQDITVGIGYTVHIDADGHPFITDDTYDPMHRWVESRDALEKAGGRIILGVRGVTFPLELPSPEDTRKALIEALKARLTVIKDFCSELPVVRERAWISNTLEAAYGIKAEIVPGPSTVTFTELANNP